MINKLTLLSIKIVAVVVLTFIIVRVADFIFKKLYRRLRKSKKNVLDGRFTLAAREPIKCALWVVGFIVALYIVGRETDTETRNLINIVRNVSIIVLVGWCILRFIKQLEKRLFTTRQKIQEQFDRTTVDAIMKLSRIIVVAIVALLVLPNFGINVSGLLAFGGISGLAVGFAAKDLLSNFFGALVIYLDKPFVIGDWIRSPDREIEGTVEAIGWRQTRIRNFQSRPLSIPNSLFSTIIVETPSRMVSRRIIEIIGVRHEDIDKVEKITSEIEKMLHKHKRIDKEQSLLAVLQDISPSSINLYISAFTDTADWVDFNKIRQEVIIQCVKIITNNGALIAAPVSFLNIPEM